MNRSLARVLYVDLTEETTSIASRPELFRKCLGGVGVASQILLEECPHDIDSLSAKAPLIFATGPLVGVFPSMAKAVAMFKSPLTGNLGESYAGGNLSTALRFSEYGAIVIKGASDEPVRLIVESGDSHIEDASSLWGRCPAEVEGLIRPSVRTPAKSVMSIGRAGENCVNYASAIVDHHGHFGRLGIGAVMGSKKLKAVCVCGADRTPIDEAPEFNGVSDEINRLIVEAEVMKKYSELGTAANVLALNELGALPSKNFSRSTYDRAEDVSGENFARVVLKRKASCPGCSVACIHLGALDSANPSHHEHKQGSVSPEGELVSYNYQPIFALGINLDVSNPTEILRLIGRCERLGLDAIMTGAVLAWATEAYENGLIASDETMGLRPEWGNVDTYLEMIENIVDLRNECYTAMARGVAAAAERYGGKDYAISLGKNSLAGYFTGYGHVIGTLVGARHSHLSNAGYSIDQVASIKNIAPEEIVEFLVHEEDWLNVFNSLVGCYFSREVYNKELIVKALAAVDIEHTENELMRMGREISLRLQHFKQREGFELSKERIPKRLLEIESPIGPLNPKVIQRMISHYIKIRQDAR